MRRPRSAARAAASCTLVAIAVSTAACTISPQSDATVVGPAPTLDDNSQATEEARIDVEPGREPGPPPLRRSPRQDRETISEDDG